MTSVSLSLALLACSSGPGAPDWALEAHSAQQRANEAHLSGDTRVAQVEAARARRELARTGRVDLVARAELSSCAARFASLEMLGRASPAPAPASAASAAATSVQTAPSAGGAAAAATEGSAPGVLAPSAPSVPSTPAAATAASAAGLANAADGCPGFEALRRDAAAPEQAYADFLRGSLDFQRIGLLPVAQQAAAAAGTDAPRRLADIRAIEDPLSRLVAAAAALRDEVAPPGLVALAVDTASAQGWRRPLLAWLGLQRQRALAAGDTEYARALRRRIELVSSSGVAAGR